MDTPQGHSSGNKAPGKIPHGTTKEESACRTETKFPRSAPINKTETTSSARKVREAPVHAGLAEAERPKYVPSCPLFVQEFLLLICLGRRSDILIAVMGITGSGKSSFNSKLVGTDVGIGHDLKSRKTTSVFDRE